MLVIRNIFIRDYLGFTFSLKSVIQLYFLDPGERTEILRTLMNSPCQYTSLVWNNKLQAQSARSSQVTCLQRQIFVLPAAAFQIGNTLLFLRKRPKEHRSSSTRFLANYDKNVLPLPYPQMTLTFTCILLVVAGIKTTFSAEANKVVVTKLFCS
jgi:hypothetical protein